MVVGAVSTAMTLPDGPMKYPFSQMLMAWFSPLLGETKAIGTNENECCAGLAERSHLSRVEGKGRGQDHSYKG